MPITLATVKRQRTVAGLAKSIFGLKNEPELQARAEAALIRANPHLSGEGRLTAGATIVVPEVPGLRVSGDAEIAPPPLSLIDEIDSERLARLSKITERLPEIAAQDGDAARAELRNREFIAALGRSHPELRQRLPQITDAVSTDAELMVSRAKQLHDAVQKVQADQARQKRRLGLG